ncbi:MAG: hypothetical protein AAGH15_13915 [Myxococcota bacterium]
MRARLPFLLSGLLVVACGGSSSDGPSGVGSGAGAIGAACSATSACTDACGDDADCAAAALCLAGEDYPGGLCSRTCQTSDDCPDPAAVDAFANVCAIDAASGFGSCVSGCEVDDDCREGYLCRNARGARGCIAEPLLEPFPTDVEPVRDPTCLGPVMGETSVTVRVPEGRDSFAAVPYTLDGTPIELLDLTFPDGTTSLNLRGTWSWYSSATTLLGSITPVLVPISPESPDVQGGDYTLRLIADTADLCLYVTSEVPATGPQQLAINVYPVGFALDEGIADASPFYTRFFDELDAIFTAASVRGLNRPRFEVVDAAVAAEYGMITSRRQVAELVSTSVDREDLDRFSLNLFLVNGIDIPGSDDGIFGISQGVPGAPGLHGTVASGVVASIELIEDETMVPNPDFDRDEPVDPETNPREIPDPTGGAALTAVIAAHEIGHFLGLFNTSEADQRSFDPLGDTPQCRVDFPEFRPSTCPDGDNLMFPILGNQFQTDLTPNQSLVIRGNPLTREL